MAHDQRFGSGCSNVLQVIKAPTRFLETRVQAKLMIQVGTLNDCTDSRTHVSEVLKPWIVPDSGFSFGVAEMGSPRP